MHAEFISEDDIERVYPRVAQATAEALGRNVAEIRRDRRLIEDLGAESIDLLDLVFRLEEAFGVEIEEGRIVEDARGDLAPEEFERDGHLTDAARARLRAILSEVPEDRFPPRIRTADVAYLFTVETFCKIVVRAQRSNSQATGSAPVGS